MMGRLSFNEKRVRWIKGGIESATISILVNRSPTNEFKAQRGLRQEILFHHSFLVGSRRVKWVDEASKETKCFQWVLGRGEESVEHLLVVGFG